MQRPPRENSHASEAELYRLLVENVRDYAIFVLDPAGCVQSWNPGAERLLGYTEDEIIGQSAEIFFTPEDRAAGVPQREIQQSLTEGRGNDDRWHVRQDGSRFWSGGMMTPLFDDGGTLRGFAKIMRDRTEWKQAEDRRASQQRLYDAVLSNTPDLIYVFDLDHRFTYVNEGLLTMWGRTWDDAIGKNCLELGYEPWHAAMHDREIEQVVATKQPIKGEVPFTGTFGRRIYEYIFVPVIGENGEVDAVAGTTRDVTDRRQIEEQVRHSEEQFRSLMEQAPFSIQLFSPDGKTIRVNRAWEELWGVRFEQIENYNILEDQQLADKGVLTYIQEGFAGHTARIPAIQYNPNDTIPDITQHDDPRRWLSAVIYPIKDAAGEVREVALIHEDITGRHRAEAALRESERLYRAIGESIDYGVWVCDPQGRNIHASESFLRLVGLTQEECSEFGWGSVLHPHDAERTMAAWK
jgi:PAS domain S-box-containing protein